MAKLGAPSGAASVRRERGDVGKTNKPYQGERAAAKLVRRMHKLNISEFHPDPLKAIAEAEAKAKPVTGAPD